MCGGGLFKCLYWKRKRFLNKDLSFCLKKLKKKKKTLNERKEIIKIRMETEIENSEEERKLTKSDFILWKD